MYAMVEERRDSCPTEEQLKKAGNLDRFRHELRHSHLPPYRAGNVVIGGRSNGNSDIELQLDKGQLFPAAATRVTHRRSFSGYAISPISLLCWEHRDKPNLGDSLLGMYEFTRMRGQGIAAGHDELMHQTSWLSLSCIIIIIITTSPILQL